MTMELRLGRKTYPVADYAEASRIVCNERDRRGVGASRFPDALIYEGDNLIGYVSYNGRVWAGNPRLWRPGHQPLYEAA